MTPVSHRDSQMIQLSILKRFDRICEAQGLRYLLYAGTLLGAVRHKGFIPWDDDVDVCMPRADYDKLCDYFKQNAEALYPLSLVNLDTNDEVFYTISRITDRTTTLVIENRQNLEMGLFIDIYPLDALGRTYEQAVSTFKSVRKTLQMFRLSQAEKPWGRPTRFQRARLKILFPIVKRIGKKRLAKYLVRRAGTMNKDPKNAFIGCDTWSFKYTVEEGIFPADMFEKRMRLPFEDGEFWAPQAYDQVLRTKYHDYMQLPPPEKRVPEQHHYKAYFREESRL